ncbi:GNAT family N-acetyltransferase [Streptomyces sp. NPDC093224]|uniref:GNAT family N-acetyltransferase n=1 Tax=Streptomyces sp. NPDC093224 TaxID=3155198 RepID=UPI003416BAE5
MDLLPFSPAHAAHAATVAGWATSATELALWCGAREFPLPPRAVIDWHGDGDVRPHLLFEGGEPVGYGELWLDADEDEVELARIIVAPELRGRSIGRTLVAGLLARALETGHADVFLRVHPDNGAALRCYLGAGFVPVEAQLADVWNASQPVAYTWLRHSPATPAG